MLLPFISFFLFHLHPAWYQHSIYSAGPSDNMVVMFWLSLADGLDPPNANNNNECIMHTAEEKPAWASPHHRLLRPQHQPEAL